MRSFGAFGSLLLAARLLKEHGGDNENGDFHVAMLTLFGPAVRWFLCCIRVSSLIPHLVLCFP